MKILWVKAGKILPVDTGGRIRSYNIMRHLAARNELIFLSYYPGERDEEYEREVSERFPGAVSFPAGAPAGRVGQAMHYLLRLPGSAPYAVAKFTAPSVKRAVLDIIERERPDVAVCDFLSASLNFPDPLPVPSVLFQHNVEHALWERQARHEPNLVKRALFKVEALKMRRYEQATVGRFHHVVAVSGNDRSLMSPMTDPSRITVVPTGVEVSSYHLDACTGRSEKFVMFLGSMDWPANIDGVEFFCAEIWPRVIAAVPDARFQVVGRNPPPRIQRLASSSVEIVGGVESVLQYLRGAPVFVVPLRVGGGTRLKIYEAMAAERAIVSTSVGAEGLDFEDGRDLVIADDATSFGDAVIRLLADPAAREALGRAAGLTAARFDWSAVARDFEEVLHRTATGAGAPLALSTAVA
jgi:glycosyltransferase involved in cell wall biosynthesis